MCGRLVVNEGLVENCLFLATTHSHYSQSAKKASDLSLNLEKGNKKESI